MRDDCILSVRDLNVKFSLRERVLHAIRGVSLDLYRGESLAIVGESGSGKSVFTKTFMGLLDANGWVDSGSILYEGNDLAQYKTEKEWLTIRGREIAMVLQDPMTSLNPLKTIGAQIEEALRLHQGLRGAEAPARARRAGRGAGARAGEPGAPRPARPPPRGGWREAPGGVLRALPPRALRPALTAQYREGARPPPPLYPSPLPAATRILFR